jgi:hypothetical protein
MLKIGAALLVLILFTPSVLTSVYAGERRHQVDLSLGKTSSEFKSIGLDSSLVVHKNWDLLLGAYYSNSSDESEDQSSDQDYKTIEGNFGTKWYANSIFDLWFNGHGGKEGDEISYRGSSFGFSTKLNKFWDSSYTTKLSLEAESNDFTHSATTSGLNREISTSFTQKVLTTRLSQFIGDDFLVYARYSAYDYNVNLDDLSSYFSLRSNIFSESNDMLNGLNKYSSSLGMTWFVTSDFDFDLNIGKSKKVIDSEVYKSINLGPNLYIGDFNTGFTVSRSTNEDGEKTDYYEASFGFVFP